MLIAIALAIDDYTRVSEIVSIVTGGADGNSFSSYASTDGARRRSSASGSGAGRARGAGWFERVFYASSPFTVMLRLLITASSRLIEVALHTVDCDLEPRRALLHRANQVTAG